MNTTLILIGIGCIIGAIIGGGVKLVQIELSPVASLWRQLLLGCFGLVLVGCGLIAGQTAADPVKTELVTPDKPNVTPNNVPSNAGTDRPQPNSAGASQDYILPGSDSHPLSPADLAGLSPAQLRLARNEIYARHGRRFASADLAAFFSKKPWYQPSDAPVTLSPLEQANVDLIAKLEKSGG